MEHFKNILSKNSFMCCIFNCKEIRNLHCSLVDSQYNDINREHDFIINTITLDLFFSYMQHKQVDKKDLSEILAASYLLVTKFYEETFCPFCTPTMLSDVIKLNKEKVAKYEYLIFEFISFDITSLDIIFRNLTNDQSHVLDIYLKPLATFIEFYQLTSQERINTINNMFVKV